MPPCISCSALSLIMCLFSHSPQPFHASRLLTVHTAGDVASTVAAPLRFPMLASVKLWHVCNPMRPRLKLYGLLHMPLHVCRPRMGRTLTRTTTRLWG
jgi:hypothetical protein